MSIGKLSTHHTLPMTLTCNGKVSGNDSKSGGGDAFFNDNWDVFINFRQAQDMSIDKLSMQHNGTVMGTCDGEVSGNCSKCGGESTMFNENCDLFK